MMGLNSVYPRVVSYSRRRLWAVKTGHFTHAYQNCIIGEILPDTVLEIYDTLCLMDPTWTHSFHGQNGRLTVSARLEPLMLRLIKW